MVSPVVVPNVLSKSVVKGAAHHSAVPYSTTRSDRFAVLTVSRYYPHKNLEAVVDALESFEYLIPGVEWWHTVEHSHGLGAMRLLWRISNGESGRRIRKLGEVPQSELPEIYSQASAVILPTLMESFSGVYPEAMFFGKPILTSDRDFAREVCGPAALYFNPRNPLEIAEAIARLRNSPELAEALVANGRQRLTKISSSWDSVAGVILDRLGMPRPS
jgi:glycosyltransferase involved in cell wall biosynthesis